MKIIIDSENNTITFIGKDDIAHGFFVSETSIKTLIINAEAIKEKTEKQNKEIERLNEVVDKFTAEMRNKLSKKVLQGTHGWDNLDNGKFMVKKLEEQIHVDKSCYPDFIDIANYAMFLWNLRQILNKENQS